MNSVDLFIIGGGINGAGIARDAAGRGLSVMLAEMGDYASGTSSSSTKLIHGGLRYLETLEFGLVRESLHERATLMKTAPYLVRPQRFILPMTSDQKRASWKVWLGLKLYDFLAGKGLPKSCRLPVREALRKPRLNRAGLTGLLAYFDCQTDDARLTLATLLDAREKGADVANYRKVTALEPNDAGFEVTYREKGATEKAQARFVVNAAGPWANDMVDMCKSCELPRKGLRLVRGSHVLLKLPEPEDHDAYLLQNTDGRVIFVIPWRPATETFLIVGTTDMVQEGNPGGATCSDEEREYLLDCYNRYFSHVNGHPATEGDVVWKWAGVRPLVDDGAKNLSKVTRDVDFAVSAQGSGGFVTIYGGKLTTYRALAEKVMEKLGVMGADIGPAWTATAPLPGGDLSRAELEQKATNGPGMVPVATRLRWAETYGSRIDMLFEQISSPGGPGQEVAPGVFEVELYYATEIEDARCGDDFLIRRTKMGLELSDAEQDAIRDWFAAQGLRR